MQKPCKVPCTTQTEVLQQARLQNWNKKLTTVWLWNYTHNNLSVSMKIASSFRVNIACHTSYFTDIFNDIKTKVFSCHSVFLYDTANILNYTSFISVVLFVTSRNYSPNPYWNLSTWSLLSGFKTLFSKVRPNISKRKKNICWTVLKSDVYYIFLPRSAIPISTTKPFSSMSIMWFGLQTDMSESLQYFSTTIN